MGRKTSSAPLRICYASEHHPNYLSLLDEPACERPNAKPSICVLYKVKQGLFGLLPVRS